MDHDYPVYQLSKTEDWKTDEFHYKDVVEVEYEPESQPKDQPNHKKKEAELRSAESFERGRSYSRIPNPWSGKWRKEKISNEQKRSDEFY